MLNLILDAIKAAGLWHAFQQLARYDGQAYIIADETGRQHINIKDLDLARPEIDRPLLRRMLLDSVHPDTVRWNRRLERVAEDADGIALHFAGGVVERGFGLVVGADGARSRVRDALCTVPPFYAGLCGFEMWIRDPDGAWPDVSALAGNGSHWAFGRDGRLVSMQRQGDRSIQAYAYKRAHESWIQGGGGGLITRTARL